MLMSLLLPPAAVTPHSFSVRIKKKKKTISTDIYERIIQHSHMQPH